MALARLALKNLSQRLSTSPSLLSHGLTEKSPCVGVLQTQRWNDEVLKRFMATTAADKGTDETSQGKEVAVTEGGKKSKLFLRRKGRRGGLWTKDRGEFVPALQEFFPSGLGNALLQATENINRLLENLNLSQLMGRVKEQDDYYKLRYEVPGLSKDELKITVHDGVLTLKGEHKDEQESDEEYSYEYYNTSLVLPDDANVDDIKAEMKNGVLYITIPRTEKPRKDEKEIKIQ